MAFCSSSLILFQQLGVFNAHNFLVNFKKSVSNKFASLNSFFEVSYQACNAAFFVPEITPNRVRKFRCKNQNHDMRHLILERINVPNMACVSVRIA